MVFKVKIRIILSAISTEFCSFRDMMKPNLCKKNYSRLGSPPKRAKWEGNSRFFDKSG